MKWLFSVPLPWLGACAGEPAPELVWQLDHGLVYCYATLAKPECYPEPRPEGDARLIAIGPRLSYQPHWQLD